VLHTCSSSVSDSYATLKSSDILNSVDCRILKFYLCTFTLMPETVPVKIWLKLLLAQRGTTGVVSFAGLLNIVVVFPI
jgi:hypothetical protein